MAVLGSMQTLIYAQMIVGVSCAVFYTVALFNSKCTLSLWGFLDSNGIHQMGTTSFITIAEQLIIIRLLCMQCAKDSDVALSFLWSLRSSSQGPRAKVSP